MKKQYANAQATLVFLSPVDLLTESDGLDPYPGGNEGEWIPRNQHQ